MLKLNIASLVLAVGLINVGCGKFSAVAAKDSSPTGSLPGFLTFRGLAPADATCRIRIPVCIKDSGLQGTHEVSADQVTCLGYSKLVFDHCGNSESQLITAEYLVKGVVRASSQYPEQVVTQPATTPSTSQISSAQNQAAAQPATSCQIEVPSCPNAGVPKSFQDSEAAANQSADRCVQRAEDFYRWCAGSSENPILVVTARFYQNGNVTAVKSFPSAGGTQCMVKLVNGCPGNSQYTQRAFADFNSDSHTSGAVCAAQAERYANICAIQVKTEFYQSGAASGVSTLYPRVFNPSYVGVMGWSYPNEQINGQWISYTSITAPIYTGAQASSANSASNTYPGQAEALLNSAASDKKYSCKTEAWILGAYTRCEAERRCGVTNTGHTVCKSLNNDNLLIAEARLVNGGINSCVPISSNPGFFYCY